MKSKRIRIDVILATEIERVAKLLDISSAQASRIVFLRLSKKEKSMWDKNFSEAKNDYQRRKIIRQMFL